MKQQRGRPKGRSRDTRSFGPLGDLIRTHRIQKGLGLSDVAKACACSVQFISNIEHGRAPLPWDKVPALAGFLKISVEEVQAANLAVRSDFKNILQVGNKAAKKAIAPEASGATTLALAVMKDTQLRNFVERYTSAALQERKKALQAAARILG